MTKVRDKYNWNVGTRPPPIDSHSVVKHELVEKYLERYICVLLTNPNIDNLTISIVDGFAGGGEYTSFDGTGIHDGSPLIALRTVTQTEALLNIGRTKHRKVDAEYFFIEKNLANFEYLKNILRVRFGDERFSRDILLHQCAFQDALNGIVAKIKKRRGGERAIFLLDQYAYDQVPLQLLRHIFSSLRGAEVLLTFNVDSLITFLSDRKSSRQSLSNMGLGDYIDWDALPRLKSDDPLWRREIQKQLAAGIVKGSGAAFSTIFFITPAASSAWTYWLVHLSNVFKARDVMMELHWNLANHFSHFLEPDIFTLGHTAGRGSKLRDQHDIDFGAGFHFDAVAAKRCEDGLHTKLLPYLFNKEQVLFGDLLGSLGNSTPATAEMIRNSLDPAVRSGEIEAVSKSGVHRELGRSLQATDILRATQRSLFVL
jgi:three-Cys-motif partner protein